MRKQYLHDQRGVAMVLELVLVAAVLALIGFAIYQSSQNSKTAKTDTITPAPNSAEGLAASAAKIVEQDAANDSALAAGAEASADELTAADSEVTKLGEASNASF